MRLARKRNFLVAIPVATALAAAGYVATDAAAESMADPGAAHVTTVGVHNTYAKDTYAHLASALDAGAAMIELDVWPDIVTHEWKVSHGNPLGNDNNCVEAADPGDLYTGDTNKNLEHCLDDVRVWYGAHQGHAPLVIKVEPKAGFDDDAGMGPDEFDTVVREHLGDLVFTPADLMAKPGGGSYATPDAAAKADNWPTRSAMAGRVLLEVIPGTVEQSNPLDHLWSDEEYSRYLSGHVAQAQVFPSVLGAEGGDPRGRYDDTALRPWFVVFDGDAATYVSSVDTSWYDANHYFLIMTDAHNVPPVISSTTPTVGEATARVNQLAAAHASVVSSDWATLSTVLPTVATRG